MEASAITLLHQKTHRKLSPLAVELGVSRKRLEKFISGEISEQDLTLKEHQNLKAHPIFADILANDFFPTPKNKQFTLRRGLKYFPNKRDRGMEIMRIFFVPPYEKCGITVLTPFPGSDWDLWIVYQIDELLTLEQRQKDIKMICPFLKNRPYLIPLPQAEYKIWSESVAKKCQERGIDIHNLIDEYYYCIENLTQEIFTNFITEEDLTLYDSY